MTDKKDGTETNNGIRRNLDEMSSLQETQEEHTKKEKPPERRRVKLEDVANAEAIRYGDGLT